MKKIIIKEAAEIADSDSSGLCLIRKSVNLVNLVVFSLFLLMKIRIVYIHLIILQKTK